MPAPSETKLTLHWFPAASADGGVQVYSPSEVSTSSAMVTGELGLAGSMTWMVKLEGSVTTD
jgi:hypothetical protein